MDFGLVIYEAYDNEYNFILWLHVKIKLCCKRIWVDVHESKARGNGKYVVGAYALKNPVIYIVYIYENSSPGIP